jgi:hypothetical protein
MKKNIFMLQILLILGLQEGYAQSGVGETVNNSIASPSIASLSRYSDVPINEATGIPNINIPLLSVPMSDNTLSYPISLNYNTQNYENAERISDVGYGWSLLGTSVIYKKIIGELDECYDNPSLPGHFNNEFDDIYYYSLPGLSGKFRIKRDIVANTFALINLSPNNAKIEYVRDSNTTTFKADNFTITADNGYKYYFQEYDYGQYPCSNNDLMAPTFKSSYFLTKIINPIGVEIATLQYEKKNQVLPGGKIVYQYCKIKSIKTSKGEVTFDFTYDENLKETVNDPFTLSKVTLKNPAGETYYSYLINNSILTHPYDDAPKRKRVLSSVRKNDKNNAKIEETSFLYNDITAINGGVTDGMLEKVVIPTGGVIQYNFENNEQYFNYSDPEYRAFLEQSPVYDPVIETKETLADLPLNTETTQVYNITIPGDLNKNKRFELFVNLEEYNIPSPELPDPNDPFYPQLPQPDFNPSLTFTLKKGTQVIWSKQYNSTVYYDPFIFINTAGSYTLEVSSVDGAKATGNIGIIGIKFLPGPFRNAKEVEGQRIKNIKYYKNILETTPEKTISYGYDSFTLNNSSSGYVFYNERDTEDDPMSPYVLYNNVKVFESGKGYTNKTFKTPNDYPKVQNGGTQLEPTFLWSYYNITKNGLPSKEEAYDQQNILLVSKETNYEFANYSDVEYALNILPQKHFSKPAYITKTTQTEKLFYPGGKLLENQSETQISNLNFKPAYMKSVVDGDVTEKFLTYPINISGYAHLENAYMKGIPVKTEEKENGKMISNTSTVFANSSLLPTSVVTTNLADGSTKESVKMDLYDDKGNLLQVSSPGGLTTAMVYGYNKTSLIAKVEGATYDQVASLATDIINLSDADNLNGTNEPALLTALDNFRKNPALANYQISTYTYDPISGITTTTPPSGLREVYESDDAGRLKRLKRMERDSAGTVSFKTLKEYQYNYKH